MRDLNTEKQELFEFHQSEWDKMRTSMQSELDTLNGQLEILTNEKQKLGKEYESLGEEYESLVQKVTIFVLFGSLYLFFILF